MKVVLRVGMLLLVLVVVAAVFLYTNLDRAVKGAVEELGPTYTGTPVTLDSVSLSPLSGEGSLRGLVVGNPSGFSAANAFTLGTIDLAIDTQSLTGDTIIIDKLHIVAPEITYEASKKGNNLKVLQRTIEGSTGGRGGAPGAEAGGEGGRKMIIRDFSLVDGKVHYANKLLGDKTLEVKLPPLTLTGIGEKSNGVTAAEATAQIVSAITRQVSAAIANSGAIGDLGKQYEEQFNDKKDELKGKLEGLKNLLDK